MGKKNDRFDKWFGNSKVVDSSGLPLIVYHGSPDIRGMFQSGLRPSPSRGSVYFATSDYRTAASYADANRAWDHQNAEPGVVPFYLSIQDPMLVDGGFQHWRGTESAIEQARNAGHDGVIIRNVIDHYASKRGAKPKRKDSSTVYAFFSPTQAKSALTEPMCSLVNGQRLPYTGPNSGQFDPDDPSLMNPQNTSAARTKRMMNPRNY